MSVGMGVGVGRWGGLGGWGKALKRFFTMREKKENIGVQMCCIVEDAVYSANAERFF